MRIHVYAIFVGVFLLTSCDSGNKMNITIESRILLDQVPSASGIEFINNKFWVIGDNSPWLFELNDKLILLNKYQIFSTDSMEGETIPKKNKHDYEAMTSLLWEGNSALFIFGSGSKSPERNSGKLIQFGATNHVTNFDLTKLYELIREESKLEEDELNLEAAAVLGESIYLFNRGKNKLISLKIKDLSLFLKGEAEKIKLKVITIDLPNIDGIQAGFSGAFGDEKYNRIIFTASVENTANWIDDGAGNIEAPEHIELQVQHQMEILGYEWTALTVLVGGNEQKVVLRNRDREIGADIRQRVKAFLHRARVRL